MTSNRQAPPAPRPNNTTRVAPEVATIGPTSPKALPNVQMTGGAEPPPDAAAPSAALIPSRLLGEPDGRLLEDVDLLLEPPNGLFGLT